LLTLLPAIVIGWLPGAVVFRLPGYARERRAALEAGERIFWQVVISIALSLAVVLALASLGRYTFERLLIVDLGTATALASLARFRLRLGSTAARPGWEALIPIALLFLATWRFFPSSEYIIGGKDPGVYINEGVQIAQRGALSAPDPAIASVPNFARDLFFPSEHRTDYYSGRFMGFFIQEPEQGRVIGQFPHLFPASIAIGYDLDGLTGARRATGLWAVLGVLAVYFAGARFVGRAARDCRLSDGAQRDSSVVRALSERRGRDAGLLFATLLAVPSPSMATRSSRRSQVCCSACCSSCASTPCSAWPA
jgi:hypothetical protein